MRVEMIAYPEHLIGIGITVVKQGLNLVRPVDCGAGFRYGERPPPRQGLGEQKHVGCPDSFVVVVVPQWLARLGGQGRARFLNQLHRLCIHVDQRAPGIIGALIKSQDLFHGGPKVGIMLRGNPPTLVYVRLEEIFFIVCRPVS